MSQVSPGVVRLAARISRELSSGPASKLDLCEKLDTSPMSVQRALAWMRNDADAPLLFDRTIRAWRMDRSWVIPGELVEESDLNRAWVTVQRLQRLLEVDDVVAEVERLILSEWSCVA